MFLQALPTQNWGEKEIELLLSEAYVQFPSLVPANQALTYIPS